MCNISNQNWTDFNITQTHQNIYIYIYIYHTELSYRYQRKKFYYLIYFCYYLYNLLHFLWHFLLLFLASRSLSNDNNHTIFWNSFRKKEDFFLFWNIKPSKTKDECSLLSTCNYFRVKITCGDFIKSQFWLFLTLLIALMNIFQ